MSTLLITGYSEEELVKTETEALAPSVELTTEYLHAKAQAIKETFDDGLQWEDFGTIVGHALDFIMEHKDLSKEEVKANIITMLEHIIDITDTPYLPDSFSDPIFKAMLPPFVNLVVDGVHGQFVEVLETKPGKPTPENLHEFITAMKETYSDGFQWSDIMVTITSSIEFAGAFPSLSKQEQQDTVIDLVNHVIDDTDTPYLPDMFVDPVFKAITPIFVTEIYKRLP